MPRILDTRACPHCKRELPQPPPRTCPHCAGSLQKRYLTAGCLSSAPPVLALALGLAAWAAGGAGDASATAPSSDPGTPPGTLSVTSPGAAPATAVTEPAAARRERP